MATTGKARLDRLEYNTAAILLKADNSDDMLTYESSLSGNSYVIDKYGGVKILDNHGYYRAQWEDLMVICEELRAWILPEAERWTRS